MDTWPAQDAKARFSEMLRKCVSDGPQMVTLRGEETAVLVPVAEWRKSASAPKRSLKEWLLAPEARGELNIPPRGRFRLRPPPTFED
jgi:antitoxin Phd